MPQVKPARLKDFQPQRRNTNKHTPQGLKTLGDSIGQNGIGDGITVAANGESISGAARLETIAEFMPGVKIVSVDTDGNTLLINRRVDIPTADSPEAQRLAVASNSAPAQNYNPDGELIGMLAAEDKRIAEIISGDQRAIDAVMMAAAPPPDPDPADYTPTTLAERFIIPPFSVLDSRQGYWQERKRAWLAVGVNSESKRGAILGGEETNEGNSQKWVGLRSKGGLNFDVPPDPPNSYRQQKRKANKNPQNLLGLSNSVENFRKNKKSYAKRKK